MSKHTFENGSVLYTGKDMYRALESSFNKRNNYQKTCSFCSHQESERCNGCSVPNDYSCSCHINPPCSTCVNSGFEPTDFLINYKNHEDGKTKWECFPSSKEILEKFIKIEKMNYELSAEILTTGEVAIYLQHVIPEESIEDMIEICRKPEFKVVATKMIKDFSLAKTQEVK